MSNSLQRLDTVRAVSTPEGIDLLLRPAGPVPRAMAWLIDTLLRLVLLWIATLGLLPLLGTEAGAGIFLLLFFVLDWFAPAIFEVYSNGATPGKRMLGLRVLQTDGRPVGWAGALTRNILRTVDFLPMLFGFGLASMLLTRDCRRLGDIAADTLVVYQNEYQRRRSVPVAEPLAPALPLSLEQQRAVIEFATRQAGLTPERAAELAEMTSLAGSTSGADAIEKLIRTANFCLGRGR